ncbi:MAG: thiamine phosphate synthase [Sphingomonas sp.]|nr:thiamine phosphate synthase [Sphingomonas sp.]
MKHRQTSTPRQWLITDQRLGPEMLRLIGRLPRGSGVLVRHHHLRPSDRRQLLRRVRRVGRQRNLEVIDEDGGRLARVHGAREIRQARLAGARILLLSPLFETRSHPHWRALSRMRAAALVRLAKMPVIALGGMDERRFRRVEKLGFAGWAGINAWLTFTKVPR